MPYTPNSTWVDGSGGGTPLSAARLNNVETGIAWSYDAHTLVITAGGGSPTVGNGTVVARYCQRGKFVHYYGQLTFGSTTSLGTGTALFSLPATAASTTSQRNMGRIFDASSTNQWWSQIQISSGGTTFAVETLPSFGTPVASVTGTSPMTWTTSDVMTWNIVYESA